jgi:hypothetical protein
MLLYSNKLSEEIAMRRLGTTMILLLLAAMACGGGPKLLKLGDSPLTIQVTSPDAAFDGFANVYINGQFIGTTDRQSQTLKINLEKGQYVIIVAADGYTPWRSRITLLGADYKQNVLAKLTIPSLPAESENTNQATNQ